MSSFRSLAGGLTIRELNLSSRAFEVPYEEALENSGFADALELHGLWLLMPDEIPCANEVKLNRFEARLLPSLYILDVLDSGEDFSWRLFGTNHAKYFGAEATGHRMSEVAPFEASAASALEFSRECYRSARPVFFITEFFDDLQTIRRVCSVALPLSGPNGQIKRLFGCYSWN